MTVTSNPLSIAITYNTAGQWDRIDINSVVDGVTSIRTTLEELGHKTSLHRASDGIARLVQQLDQAKPDLVFNLCEGFHEKAEGEFYVAAVLELLGIPYTGSGPLALALGLNKPLTKQLFTAAGILTPAFTVYTPGSDTSPRLPYPVILKLAGEDASLSITRENVAADDRSFAKRLKELLDEHRAPVMVEQFIDGREFTVALLDGEPIVLEEIEFSIEPKILCFRAKWANGSAEDIGTRAVFSPSVTADEQAEMFDLAKRVWNLIGLRDYGRVDFRMDAAGRLYVLEVNPNPDITPASGYRSALEAGGIMFPDFVNRLITMTHQRGTSTHAVAR